ncbi:UDP-N-acetylmuramoyl-tripeptide--D-alanyl-D-alanine ligase [Nocardia otitidiscaviarum]|uniref:UDP-N-acetylmuramoyl-tripeptide--D-alanyl-D- alanine ligase n=1 Tax=Nocardia otitidiscaviarum TaxID=1823 RepID=UPI000694CCCF|nr:UDP-N-acetylmuramoyl-tripeptide--D-alanyl-D-alanine ligase [Nocardia otitidiscaviarum]MBF6485802.1 UDP-N-acetylmuramoyl-tripeptide--D-alanyl-D-alanine ligase [Nocardia otitidiscaviarum]
MIEMTLREIADVVGGTLHDCPDPEVTVTGAVEFDSRRIGSGDLFLALPGARVDGHDYARQAVAAGAVAVLAARPVGVPAIVVTPPSAAPPARDGDTWADGGAEGHGTSRALALAADTDGSGAAVLAALAKLARTSVDRLVAAGGLTVVGVTGSSGKTSTKDLLAAVLSPLGPVVAPPGSFNNELGHPWTALRADADTRFLVLELSARGRGHIRALTEVAPPGIGVVLNVGTAHLGEFGSREAIAETKGELVEALPATGLAVLNADDPLVSAMAARTAARVVQVGQAAGADLRATDVTLDEQARARFTLRRGDESVDVTLAVHGEHQVGNALAAAAVALECGADLATAATALGAAQAVSERRMDVRTRADGVTVINDSYNANPDSVRAALKALVTMAKSGDTARRSWAVIGEMGELGEESVLEHDRIGRLAVRLDVDRFIVVGAGRPVRAMFQGAVQEGSWGEEAVHVPDIAAAVELLDSELAPGDVVLVKASKSVGLWTVAEHLTAAAVADARPAADSIARPAAAEEAAR